MQNFDMDSIIEYAVEKIKQEIRSVRGSKIKDIDIDDIACNDRRLSFQVIGYDAKGKPVSEEYFSCSLNFEDAATESEDDIKWLIDNNAPEFAYNFVKSPVRPTLREDAEYNIQFYQIFSNPEKPTDNGKMIAQAGTEDEAKAKGNELVGKGNYLIKAVCDDGKVRDVDLHDYFNESASLKEAIQLPSNVWTWFPLNALSSNGISYLEFLGKDSPDQEFVARKYFYQPTNSGKLLVMLIGIDDEEFLVVMDDGRNMEILYQGSEKWANYILDTICDLDNISDVDSFIHAMASSNSPVREVEQQFALNDVDNIAEYMINGIKKYPEEWKHNTGRDSVVASILDELKDKKYGYYRKYDYDLTDSTLNIVANKVCDLIMPTIEAWNREHKNSNELISEGVNTYNVTFYMASLDDQMPDGPITTKSVYAASEADAEKKLMDSSTDKYYIPTITDVELVESIVTEELKPGDRVYVTVSNRQGNVIQMVSDDVVEVELDGGLYPARIDRFYVDEVKLLDMQPEVDDEIDYDDVDPDAVVDSLKEGSAEYVAKPSALSRDDIIEHLLDATDEQEFIFSQCDKMIAKYQIEANPDWDLDDILETFTTDQLEELLQLVMNKIELEEDLGHTIGTALFCTASIEVCTIGGVDEDGEDIDEPVIFDDKTPVNTILAAIDPDTDAGDAKCAEINQLLNAMPDGYIQVQAYCRGRDMGDRQVYDAYELYDELRDIFNLDESLTESNNAYTYRGHYIINDGSTWMIKDGNNQVIRSGIATDSEAEEIIDDLDESVDYEDAFVADDDM